MIKVIVRKLHMIYNYFLYKVFDFGKWHIIPYEDKEYAQDIVKELNRYLKNVKGDGYIVEVGCGLGDIIKRIDCNKKIGYDISDNVLKAAKFICKDMVYEVGSFDTVCQKHIKCLIMVNFIHGINPDVLKSNIRTLLKKCDIDMFVMDRITNIRNTPYKFSQLGGELFDGYTCIWSSKPYNASEGAIRIVEFWKKV